ncbi:RDD family protein [Olleya sp. YS]|uniref:RDD family protein n=1 Tax=Olleya sp. YS TaxID=3028318 RepID=UPI002434494A|nr:RDD family protein [Olleya sp. YS]WGD34484.1 RDD family protein [Olleya sp. YS]
MYLNINNEFRGFDLLTLFLSFALIIGAIIYERTNTRENKLLNFSFAVLFIGTIFKICQQPIEIVFINQFDKMNESIFYIEQNMHFWFNQIYQLILNLILFFISYYVLKQWNNKKQLLQTETNINQESDYIISKKWKRVVHLIIDLTIYFFISFMFFNKLIQLISTKLHFHESLGRYFGIALMLVFTLAYYTFFEYLFKITPAKIITHSKVISKTNENLNIKSFLKRSLIRLIPFNPFSYLFIEGWHDGLSNTTVVDVKEESSYKIVYWLLFILLIASIVFNILFNPFV